LTAEDITTTVRIHFSHRGIKLFKNEPHKKFISGRWVVIKDLGYPFGSSDTTGWRVSDGKFCGVEIKTINDVLSEKQIDFLNMLVADNCDAYLAKELKDGTIKLTNWKTKIEEIIEI